MGIMKYLIDEQDHQEQVAISIAVKAKVLERCEFHEDSVYSTGEPIESAYKLGNTLYTAGKLKDIYSDRNEMTDAIKDAVESIFSDECVSCAKWNRE